MGGLNISKKMTIHASLDKIFSILSDFNHWITWSPWLIAEPDAKVDVSALGKSYSWEGKRIGSGKMTITDETDSSIHFDLVFTKPRKSKAKVSFYLRAKIDSTEVEWTMNSKWPFFLFFMKKQMESFIGMDYDRGLKMLKEYVESGQVSSEIEFMGVNDYDGCNYVGFTKNTPLKDVGAEMAKDFKALKEWSTENNIEILGDPFSQYHKWDVVNNQVNYTAAIPVDKDVKDIPKGSKKGMFPKLKLHTIRHYGPHEYLGNAWSTIMLQERNKEFKAKKGVHPMEFYRNNPILTDPKDLITDVCLALN